MQTGQTALHVAVEHAGEPVAKALKRHGAKFSVADGAGDNGLHFLARHGRGDLLKLRDEADWRRAVCAVNHKGAPSMHLAARLMRMRCAAPDPGQSQAPLCCTVLGSLCLAQAYCVHAAYHDVLHTARGSAIGPPRLEIAA